jgi:hypothetical protein
MLAMASKKSDRSKDRHTAPRLVFHLPQWLFDAFRAHVDGLPVEATDAAVLRAALEQYLRNVGALPPEKDRKK